MKQVIATAVLFLGMIAGAAADESASLPVALQGLVSQSVAGSPAMNAGDYPASEQMLARLEDDWHKTARQVSEQLKGELAERIPDPIR